MPDSFHQGAIARVFRSAFDSACHNQIMPDDKNCAICKSPDHYAYECNFNGFNIWLEQKKAQEKKLNGHTKQQPEQPG